MVFPPWNHRQPSALPLPWVQIIKAILLLSACFVLVALSWSKFGFSLPAFVDALLNDSVLQGYLSKNFFAGSAPSADLAKHFFELGLYLKDPLELISLGLALILGTAAMPHILMRFFTVPNAQVARSSMLWAMLAIGACHLMIVLIGFAATHYVGSPTIAAFKNGGNLAAPLLAQYLGGGADSFWGNLMQGFVAAVAFATIVAVVAGLTLAAASCLAHDIYVGTIKQGHARGGRGDCALRTLEICPSPCWERISKYADTVKQAICMRIACLTHS